MTQLQIKKRAVPWLIDGAKIALAICKSIRATANFKSGHEPDTRFPRQGRAVSCHRHRKLSGLEFTWERRRQCPIRSRKRFTTKNSTKACP
jgi:hypothetical protein